MAETYKGSCFCGAVDVAVTGTAVAEGYCHCQSCRSWAAAPVNAFTLWKPEDVKFGGAGERLHAVEARRRQVHER